MADEVDEFLQHFGVKGMHWGVRKQRDTSVDTTHTQSVQAKREARAQKYIKRANDAQTTISAIQARGVQKGVRGRVNAADIKDLQKVKDQALKDADAKRNGHLSSGQKKVLIGTAVAAAVIGGSLVYANVQNGEFNRLAVKGAELVKGKQEFPFKQSKEFASFKTPEDVFSHVVKGINPDYGKPGTKVNCRRATFAYELRRRGYDVRATRTTGSTGQNPTGLYNALNKGKKQSTSVVGIIGSSLLRSKSEDESRISALAKNNGVTNIQAVALGKRQAVTPKAIFDALTNQPDGSRGELSVHWLGGGGHSLAYEIFNGKPVVFDTQSGHKYDSVESIVDGIGHVASAGLTRLDNVDLNTDFLNRWVKNA